MPKQEDSDVEMLKTFILKVEPLVGSDVRDVAVDLCQLADRVGVRCEADVSGVKLWARPGDNPLRLAEAFYEQLKRPAQHYKIAQAD